MSALAAALLTESSSSQVDNCDDAPSGDDADICAGGGCRCLVGTGEAYGFGWCSTELADDEAVEEPEEGDVEADLTVKREENTSHRLESRRGSRHMRAWLSECDESEPMASSALSTTAGLAWLRKPTRPGRMPRRTMYG